VTAQLDAIAALEKYATAATRSALTDVIEGEQCFYEVRCEAAKCLTKVANSMHNWTGPPAMLNIFRKLFGSFSAPHIVRQNNFDNFQHYFLQKTIPVAMAGLRTAHGICPPEIMRFLLDLFKYNDNIKNHYSDVYYRSSLIDALGTSITPVISVIQQGTKITSENLSTDAKLVLEEVTRILNLEKHLPSYKYRVSVSCLKVIRKLQKCGHLPPSSKIYKSYAVYGQYIDVRLAAMECLVDFVKVDGTTEDLEHLLQMLENDPDPEIRHQLSRLIVENPPFTNGRGNRLNKHDLRERIWSNMNFKMAHDTRLRCDMVDIYYALYGTREPPVIKNPELAALYQPQKVEPDSRDEHDMKIELDDQLVDVKEPETGPTIEGDFKSIEIITEEPIEEPQIFPIEEEDDTDVMIVETQSNELVMKIETDEFKVFDTASEQKIFEPVKQKVSPVDLDEAGPSVKKIKTDYASDNSQSQPSVDLNDFTAEGGEIKSEHSSKVRSRLMQGTLGF